MTTVNYDETVTLKTRDLRGSKLRCLTLTSMPRDQVSSVLTELIAPVGSVSPEDRWIPEGFARPEEARLDRPSGYRFVPDGSELQKWWLKRPKGANTPNWDLVSTCKVGNHDALLLVEAKAHDRELHTEGKPDGDAENAAQIKAAVREANTGLGQIIGGWRLSCDSHYQLCNRLAWAWKIASLGKPTILVYLGFLRASEMGSQNQESFASTREWERCFRKHAIDSQIVPQPALGRALETNGAPLWLLVKAIDMKYVVSGERSRRAD